MAKTIRCSNCSRPFRVSRSTVSAQGTIDCPDCGKRYRLKIVESEDDQPSSPRIQASSLPDVFQVTLTRAESASLPRSRPEPLEPAPERTRAGATPPPEDHSDTLLPEPVSGGPPIPPANDPDDTTYQADGRADQEPSGNEEVDLGELSLEDMYATEGGGADDEWDDDPWDEDAWKDDEPLREAPRVVGKSARRNRSRGRSGRSAGKKNRRFVDAQGLDGNTLESRIQSRRIENDDSEFRDALYKSLIAPAVIAAIGIVMFVAMPDVRADDVGGRLKPFVEAFGRNGILVFFGMIFVASLTPAVTLFLEAKYRLRTRSGEWFDNLSLQGKIGVGAAGVLAFIVVVGGFTAFALLRIEAKKNPPAVNAVASEEGDGAGKGDDGDRKGANADGRFVADVEGSLIRVTSVPRVRDPNAGFHGVSPMELKALVPPRPYVGRVLFGTPGQTVQDLHDRPKGTLPNLEPDPAPAAEPVAFPSDLVLEGRLVRIAEIGRERSSLTKVVGRDVYPLLASRNGPFAIVPADVGEDALYRTTKDLRRNDDGTFVPVETRRKLPLPLIDLRTGKQVGEFAWNAPLWRQTLLSPQGTWLVGPQPMLEASQRHRQTLYVWKRDAVNDEPQPLPVGGYVKWWSFVDETRLALLVVETEFTDVGENVIQIEYGPAQALQFWDVAEAKRLASVDLQPLHGRSLIRRARDNGQVEQFLVPQSSAGAVSGTGRYVAVDGGVRGIEMVSTSDYKRLGRLEVGDEARDRENRVSSVASMVTFSRDGTEISAMHSPIRTTWSATTGDWLRSVSLPVGNGQNRGEMYADTTAGLVFASGRMGDYHRLQPSELVDTLRPRTPLQLPPALRLAPDGSLLIIGRNPELSGQPRPRQQPETWQYGVYASAAHRDAIQTFRSGVRPVEVRAVARASRKNVRTIEAELSSEWRPLPPVKSRVSRSEARTLQHKQWPIAWSDWEAAALRLVLPAPVPDRRVTDLEPGTDLSRGVQLYWDRIDLATGEMIGEPILLNGNAATWLERGLQLYGATRDLRAALTSDASLLAVTNLEVNASGIDVYERSGEHVTGFVPYDEQTPVRWISWLSPDRLLTAGGGRLTCWTYPEFDAVYELDRDYRLPIRWAPGHVWLVVSAGRHLEFVDPESGEVLGHCSAALSLTVDRKASVGAIREVVAGPKDFLFTDAAVSPDGRYLCGWLAALPETSHEQTRHRNALDLEALGSRYSPTSNRFQGAILWELSSGRQWTIRSEQVRYGIAEWLSPRELLVADSQQAAIYDVVDQAEVAMTPQPLQAAGHAIQTIQSSPDGRVWVRSQAGRDADAPWNVTGWIAQDADRTSLFAQAAGLPDQVEDGDGGEDGDGEVGGRSYPPIQVEVDLGTRAVSQQQATRFASFLAAHGRTIGPGGDILRITHEVIEDKQGSGGLTTNLVDGIRIPLVTYTGRLIETSGKQSVVLVSQGRFPFEKSRYFVKSSRRKPIQSYNFPGRPWDAIVSEILGRGIGLDPRSLAGNRSVCEREERTRVFRLVDSLPAE